MGAHLCAAGGLTWSGSPAENGRLLIVVDRGLMTVLKIRGVMAILDALDDPTSPYHYPAIDGLYDSLAMTISDKLGWFYDLGWGERSLVKLALSGAIRVLPR